MTTEKTTETERRSAACSTNDELVLRVRDLAARLECARKAALDRGIPASLLEVPAASAAYDWPA